MIRVLLVDDHDLVRAGIRHLLAEASDIEVAGEADSGEEALRKARDIVPDVVLMDIRMPGMGGLEATRRLVNAHPEICVIVVTVCDQAPFPARLLKAGALGYLTKGASTDEMVAAIRSVHQGKRYLSGVIAQQLALANFDVDTLSQLDTLSERELQVMIMIASCEPPQLIAERLHLSRKTINTYRYRIFDKLNISSDVEMAVLAIRHGMIDVSGAEAVITKVHLE